MVQQKSRFWLEVLVMVALTVGCAGKSAAGSWSFQYEKGKPTANAAVRGHEVSLTPLTGRVYVYAAFAMGPENPIPPAPPQPPEKPHWQFRGRQFVTLGQTVKGEFKPAVRFGIDDLRRGSGAEGGLMYAYLYDGKLNYYGSWIRPDTPFDFRLHMDLDRQQMTVLLDNRQKARPLDEEALSARIQLVLAALELGDEAELSLVITDDADIAALNQQYLGRVGPTNVLAFAQGEGEGSGLNPGLLGDVVVSIETSDREAAENGLDPGEHLMRLIIHGLLHLLGHDHVRGGDPARRMEELTEELLEGSAS